MQRLAIAVLALCLMIGQVFAQSNRVQTPWLPIGKGTAITATTSSAATQLPAGGNVAWLCNTSTTIDAYVAVGGSTVSTTTALGSWLKAGTCGAYDMMPVGGPGINQYVALITGSSTAAINVETGVGNPPLNSISGGGGGGGSVTQGTTPWLVAPNTSAAWALGTFGSAMGTLGLNLGVYDGTNLVRAKGDETNGIWVNVKAGVTGVVTINSGGVSSGAYASGAFASGAFASGSVASGAFASGALASGSIAAGAMVDLLTMRGTKAAGTAAANSLLAGGVYNSAGITLTDGQQASLQLDATGNLKVAGPVTMVSGAVASGAYASGALASGSIASGAMVDLLTMRGSKAAGTAAVNSMLAGGVYNASGITLTDGQQAGLQFDASGNLKVSGQGVAQGSATSGQTISPVGAAAATSPPTTTNGNTYPLSMTTAGALRSDLSSIAGTATDTNSGNKSAGTLRNVLATDQLALATWGQGATAATAPSGATQEGCRAQNAEPTAVTNGQMVGGACDLVGKRITLPYANPENVVRGSPAAVTNTTSTQILAAPATGLRNYVTTIVCQNSHATVGTWINIQDGSGGTTLWQIYAGPLGGGAGPTFPTPLAQPTTATGLFFAPVTTGANVVCNAIAYKGV